MKDPNKSVIFNWLWIDLETTGLDEREGQILEVAAACVDDAGTFQIVDSCETVVLPERELVMDQYVREMHTRNGLLAKIQEGDGMPLADADEMLRAFVDQYLVPNEKVVLAGGSVHFDLRWIKHHMPRLAEKLHYRVFDVSTLKAAASAWADEHISIKGDRHRAMADVEASIKEAKAFLDLVRV